MQSPNSINKTNTKIQQGAISFTDPDKKSKCRKIANLVSKKEAVKQRLNLPRLDDDFDSLSLEKQIEVIMKPVINPEIAAEAIEKLIGEKNSSQDQVLTEGYDQTDSQFEAERTFEKEITSKVKVRRSQKESISLPPINDPFSSNQALNHWHYNQPVKHNGVNSRPSINASAIQGPIKKNKQYSSVKNLHILNDETVLVHKLFDLQNSSLTSRSQTKNGILSMPSSRKETPFENLQMHLSSNKQDFKLLEKLNGPKLISTEEMMASKKVSNIQDASMEANHLLNPSGADLGQINKNLLEMNQARSQHMLTDADKRSNNHRFEEERVNISSSKMNISKVSTKEATSPLKPLSSIVINQKAQQSPSKKQQYYNKWFVPVKYWRVAKETNSIEKKYEELKKDINYFYNNLHNYSIRNNQNPLKDKRIKTDQQASWEGLQEKLRQNNIIRKYKKQLAENSQRVPNFLRTIEEEETHQMHK